MSQPDIIKQARHHFDILWTRRLIVASVFVIYSAITLLYLSVAHRYYAASAHVLVLQQGSRALGGASNDSIWEMGAAESFIQTQMALLRSPDVLGNAIESIGIDHLPTLRTAAVAGRSTPREAILDLLKISQPDRGARVLKIDYRAKSLDEATRTVTAIVSSYQRFLVEQDRSGNFKDVEILTKAVDGLSTELGTLEAEYSQFRTDHPLSIDDEFGRSYVTRSLEQFDRAEKDAEIKAAQLKSQLKVGRKLSENGAGLAEIAYALGQLGGEPNGGIIASALSETQYNFSDYVRQLAQEQQRLAERNGNQSTKVRELETRIAQTMEVRRNSRRQAQRGEINGLINSIEESLVALESTKSELTHHLEREHAKVKDLVVAQLKESNLRRNLERKRDLFNTFVNQLKQVQVIKESNSVRASTIGAASGSPRPVLPRTGLILAIAFIAAVVTGVGAAYVGEVLDCRIRNQDELRRLAKLPVLGVIHNALPAVAPVATTIRHTRRASRSWSEPDSFHELRRTLEELSSSHGTRAILLTSPAGPHRAELTSLGSGLAIDMVQAGRRVLLVDAALDNPSLDRIHQVPRGPGFADILNECLDGMSLVRSTGVENLDILTTGTKVHQPFDSSTSSRLDNFLGEARQVYDLIVFNADPLSSILSGSLLASHVDGVVLAVSIPWARQRAIEGAIDLLAAIGVPVLGILALDSTVPRQPCHYPGVTAPTRGDIRSNGVHKAL